MHEACGVCKVDSTNTMGLLCMDVADRAHYVMLKLLIMQCPDCAGKRVGWIAPTQVAERYKPSDCKHHQGGDSKPEEA